MKNIDNIKERNLTASTAKLISQLGNFFFPIGEIKSASQAGIWAFNKYSDNLQVAKNIGNDILADVTIFHRTLPP